MRKTILATLLAAVMLPAAAQAQTAELRHDRREIRQEQRELQRAVRQGAPRHVIRDERQDVRQAHREYQQDRQDWREYRRSHRSEFRRSAYVAPRGYRYRPVSVGYHLRPAYYTDRYRVANYSRYRLGAPGYGKRWVRYGNDMLLVNVRTGRVLQAHSGFFW